MSKRPQSIQEITAVDPSCRPPPLVIGDEIVWLSDDGPQFGRVKWIGKLPDQGQHWMAGVCFDNPIGTGNGTYNEWKLFDAPLRHASLVPVMGLLKAKDFRFLI